MIESKVKKTLKYGLSGKPKLKECNSYDKASRYSKIDVSLIGDKIFEVGCGDGNNIKNSRLWPIVKKSDYLGIDITEQKNHPLKTEVADILSYQFSEKYNTIIMFEVLEHIHLRNWKKVIQKLNNALTEKGYLIISVPAYQKMSDYLFYANWDYYQIHTVFGINKRVLGFFFPKAKIELSGNLIFNQDGTNFFWSLGRLIKRILFTNYNYYVKSFFVISQKINGIELKEMLNEEN